MSSKSNHAQLLRKVLGASHHPTILDMASAIVADIAIGTFFFAMRSYSKPRIAGNTKCVEDLGGLAFRTVRNTIVPRAPFRFRICHRHIRQPEKWQKDGLPDSATSR
jgi:hypothetical protein